MLPRSQALMKDDAWKVAQSMEVVAAVRYGTDEPSLEQQLYVLNKPHYCGDGTTVAEALSYAVDSWAEQQTDYRQYDDSVTAATDAFIELTADYLTEVLNRSGVEPQYRWFVALEIDTRMMKAWFRKKETSDVH